MVVAPVFLQGFISVLLCRESIMGRRQTFPSWPRLLVLMLLVPPLPSSSPPRPVLGIDAPTTKSTILVKPRPRYRYHLFLSKLRGRNKEEVNCVKTVICWEIQEVYFRYNTASGSIIQAFIRFRAKKCAQYFTVHKSCTEDYVVWKQVLVVVFSGL